MRQHMSPRHFRPRKNSAFDFALKGRGFSRGNPAGFSRGRYPRGAGRKPASPQRSSRPAFPVPERSRHIRPGRQSRRPARGAIVCSGYKIQCSSHYDTRTKRSGWQLAPREDSYRGRTDVSPVQRSKTTGSRPARSFFFLAILLSPSLADYMTRSCR